MYYFTEIVRIHFIFITGSDINIFFLFGTLIPAAATINVIGSYLADHLHLRHRYISLFENYCYFLIVNCGLATSYLHGNSWMYRLGGMKLGLANDINWPGCLRQTRLQFT